MSTGAVARRRPPRRVTRLNDDALSEIDVVEPVERWVECDGRRIQGWLFPARGSGAGAPPPPLVAQIHGGPHAFYAWAPTWEFQVLAGAGLSVWASNPRGSDGYGEAFNAANFRDWGPARCATSWRGSRRSLPTAWRTQRGLA